MTLLLGNRSLLDAFRRGERAALATVYTHYVQDVAALVRRGFSLSEARVVVPGERDLQRQRDLLQEVFLRAFSEKGRLGYDGVSPFRPWLLRIAKNLMIDEGRRAGRLLDTKLVAEETFEENEPALPVSPEDELEWKTLREATQAFCATLDLEQQRFVQLRFTEERSQAEVAAQLGVTRRRVRTLEETVRAGLRKHLKSLGLGG
jgi:RNA polymerase sigma factor (sigma-70 family)